MNKRARVMGAAVRRSRSGASSAVVLGLLIASLGATAPPADAAEFYTRKRVNGVWITGQFPKEEGSSQASAGTGRRGSPRSVVASAEPPLPPSPAEAGLLRPAASDEADMPLVTAALAVPTEMASDPPLDERLRRLKDALQARAGELVQKAGLSSLTPLHAPLFEPSAPRPAGTAVLPASRLPAVEDVRPAAPAPRPAAASIEPRSVSYDFETGIKTTVYASSVVREPFDVAAMKNAAPRPVAR